jgi:hypothetical protein
MVYNLNRLRLISQILFQFFYLWNSGYIIGWKCAFGDGIHEMHCAIQRGLKENDSIPSKPDMFQSLERSYKARVKRFGSHGLSNPWGGGSLHERMISFIKFKRLSPLIRIIFRLFRKFETFPQWSQFSQMSPYSYLVPTGPINSLHTSTKGIYFSCHTTPHTMSSLC